jgi:hypothetical protein
MGHFTKGQGGQMEKTKEKIIYIVKKSPRWNPHLIEKEIKDWENEWPMMSNPKVMNSQYLAHSKTSCIN